MNIIVKNEIKSSYAVSAEKGAIIYKLVIDRLKSNEKVIVDFKGISSTISTFFNSWYALLFKDYDEKFINDYVIFVNIEKKITEHQIEAVKENAIKFYKRGE